MSNFVYDVGVYAQVTSIRINGMQETLTKNTSSQFLVEITSTVTTAILLVYMISKVALVLSGAEKIRRLHNSCL